MPGGLVLRSAALHAARGAPYAPRFRYEEALEVKRSAAANLVAVGMRVGDRLMKSGVGRGLVRRLAPDPGQGPSEEAMARGFFRTRLVGQDHRLLGRHAVAPRRRVVVDVAARGVRIEPLADVALGGAGARGQFGGSEWPVGGQRLVEPEFVADVMQAMHAGDQVVPGRGRAFVERSSLQGEAGALRRHRVEHLDEVDAVDCDAVRQTQLPEMPRRLDQRLARPAAQVQPGDGRAVAVCLGEGVNGVESQFAGVAVDSGQLTLAVHCAVGHDRGAGQSLVTEQAGLPVSISHRHSLPQARRSSTIPTAT